MSCYHCSHSGCQILCRCFHLCKRHGRYLCFLIIINCSAWSFMVNFCPSWPFSLQSFKLDQLRCSSHLLPLLLPTVHYKNHLGGGSAASFHMLRHLDCFWTKTPIIEVSTLLELVHVDLVLSLLMCFDLTNVAKAYWKENEGLSFGICYFICIIRVRSK